MLEEVLVLLDELLSAEPAVLVEEVDFGELGLVLAVGEEEDAGVDEGEGVAEGAEADVGGEHVVVVGVEELRGPRSTRLPASMAPRKA